MRHLYSGFMILYEADGTSFGKVECLMTIEEADFMLDAVNMWRPTSIKLLALTFKKALCKDYADRAFVFSFSRRYLLQASGRLCQEAERQSLDPHTTYGNKLAQMYQVGEHILSFLAHQDTPPRSPGKVSTP